MTRVRIRSTLLLCVALIVDGCCFGMFTNPYSVVDCGDAEIRANGATYREFGMVVGMSWGPMCIGPQGHMNSMVWNNDYQLNHCDSSTYTGPADKCKEYEDAGNAYGGAMGLISAAMFFNNFVALSALLELMGYTVGSKCQAAYVITGGVLTTALCLAGGALCFAPGMSTGDENVSFGFCRMCYGGDASLASLASLTSIQKPHIAGAPIGALIGGLFAIVEIVIGVMMCSQADKDKETMASVKATASEL